MKFISYLIYSSWWHISGYVIVNYFSISWFLILLIHLCVVSLEKKRRKKEKEKSITSHAWINNAPEVCSIYGKALDVNNTHKLLNWIHQCLWILWIFFFPFPFITTSIYNWMMWIDLELFCWWCTCDDCTRNPCTYRKVLLSCDHIGCIVGSQIFSLNPRGFQPKK